MLDAPLILAFARLSRGVLIFFVVAVVVLAVLLNRAFPKQRRVIAIALMCGGAALLLLVLLSAWKIIPRPGEHVAGLVPAAFFAGLISLVVGVALYMIIRRSQRR